MDSDHEKPAPSIENASEEVLNAEVVEETAPIEPEAKLDDAGDPATWPILLLLDDDPAEAEQVKAYCDEKKLKFEWLTATSDLDSYLPVKPPLLALIRQQLNDTDVRKNLKIMQDQGGLENTIILLLTQTNLEETELRENHSLGFPITFKKPHAMAALDRHVTGVRHVDPDTELLTPSLMAELKTGLRRRFSTVAISRGSRGVPSDGMPRANASTKVISVPVLDPNDEKNASHLPVRTQGSSKVMPNEPTQQTERATVRMNRAPLSETTGPWDQAIHFGICASVVCVLAFAFIPGGYTHGWMRFEGPMIGLLMGLALAWPLSKLNQEPRPMTLALAALPMTLIPNTLVLFARWIFGYEIVARHTNTVVMKVPDLDPKFLVAPPPGVEPAEPAMNIDDYTSLLAVGVGFLLAWATASLVMLVCSTLRGHKDSRRETRVMRSTMSYD